MKKFDIATLEQAYEQASPERQLIFRLFIVDSRSYYLLYEERQNLFWVATIMIFRRRHARLTSHTEMAKEGIRHLI